jgi:uncharacterized protein YkwD
MGVLYALIIAITFAGIVTQISQLNDSEATVTPPAIVVVDPQPATETVPGALALINQYRSTKHLPYLALDAQLNTSAQAKADDLATVGYWAHERPGRTPWSFIDDAGYKYQRAGENLAKCYLTTKEVVEAWIASPTHEAVLTGDYQDVGFGIRHSDKNNCDYVVAHFGSPSV